MHCCKWFTQRVFGPGLGIVLCRNCRRVCITVITERCTFTCRSEMEHSEDEHHLDIVESLTQSKSSSPEVNNLVVGSEAWFAEVVGLQNWGIDPRKDVNHVYNKDLQLLFEDKVSHKGYS